MTDAPKNPQDESPNETQPTAPLPTETAFLRGCLSVFPAPRKML